MTTFMRECYFYKWRDREWDDWNIKNNYSFNYATPCIPKRKSSVKGKPKKTVSISRRMAVLEL